MIMTAEDHYTYELEKFEFVKYKFVSLRENLRILLDFLNKMGNHPEERIDNYHIMKIKTNFFIDEIDFNLQGEFPFGHLREYFNVYSNFYNRSRSELMEVIHEISLNRQLIW
ncbi:hypothetical protein GCK72_025074 [Caenorhabditis remanei]|uniref:Uncharacterized protein n=2 Tax=Caenorhabditis remanei TaxID=31234 RepID=A0A6A5G0Y2_CAERE|nr:hypothetical protein GCK72_025074 [Caenorhabditis remanei]KAF1748607.1 hypothetical protein GCK72_025074 [Caenorhabditis remanei]